MPFYSANAKDFLVSSDLEINNLKLLPGDQVILKSGDWKNQQIVFRGIGTEKLPIILKSSVPGNITLSGNSTLKIDGECLVVDGLAFADGYCEKGAVIAFSEKSFHYRLTNISILNYNHPDKLVDFSMNGSYNRVDYCSLIEKTHQESALVVWLSEKPNYNQIDHNYFGPRPDLGVNGGETIRIRTSGIRNFKNYIKGKELLSGFKELNEEFIYIKENLILLKSNQKNPFWLKESIGAAWNKSNFILSIK